jgi:hypothetical protein
MADRGTFRYLSAAFWARWTVPALGAVPANAVLVACGLVAGCFQPGFWLLTVGLETAWLVALSGSARFRAVVDAQALPPLPTADDPRLGQLVAKDREQCLAVLTLTNEILKPDLALDAQRAVRRLAGLDLELRVLRLRLSEGLVSGKDLAFRIAQAEAQLGNSLESQRADREAALAVLRRRQELLTARQNRLTAIQAQLDRIQDELLVLRDQRDLSDAGSSALDLAGSLTSARHLLDDPLLELPEESPPARQAVAN